MQAVVYHSRSIQAWEQRWFAQQNSSLGLMQQAAWTITQQLIQQFQQNKIQKIAVWCGQGNNAGDGYYIAAFLKQQGFSITVFATELGQSSDLKQAADYAQSHQVDIQTVDYLLSEKAVHQEIPTFDCHIDALLGIGLNRVLDQNWQDIIQLLNAQTGLKVSIDIPSGLQANTGQALPCAVQADQTFTILGYKAGLFTGQAKEYVGKLHLVSLIPTDSELKSLAYLSPEKIVLPKRQAFGHKGSYGHVLVVGGHADMGGAVIMSAEAAFHAGAGKVSVICHAKHHQAILARSPNIMVRDINVLDQEAIQQLLTQVDAVCFGMGLGRDEWAEAIYLQWFNLLNHNSHLEVVLDADGLWFLTKYPQQLNHHLYATPHSGEAATLLGCTAADIEQDRIAAIQQLQQKYAGQWVLKGAGSLILEEQLFICRLGNAGMGTGGMGDVLAGMIASLKAQFHQQIGLHEIVSLHAQAGDLLAEKGMRGLQAHDMGKMIYKVVNQDV
ncbi:bifunctional ADP-dependent NAD(P)H-hydrate dehydratase/NAD(P)H-hydrate epimerase [Acinetobacter genomosp. 15BJ]|uniref:ADP-dependent (S)-NAD(P)H-hydrate dehydratase n=1 Tax=Acinetobacter genomosp. 15BJ TaxID=106651 RepID=R9B7R9_9GAMM|nr:bifunctional ADP-dependent NAD(P)H-hydrate dehydratase/NAD(P)H-hydrate epimerase [Acinetobacter genomosp. 15BJ]EOR08406.1 YjeF family domain-containing protein [Acinetobacter genomosp. 15BJ]MCH7290557.1 bifunctional ADP-dependent NAD(P)H-hydrate dehydratase/NAD(P)H-hydrate epimerase [Acinetobacter genomosp. 15BJ]MDO3656987.1 bifunctional ADP-dependent NAD(P)H-hydrate dehydratase/NAD(P)H-hydrate epimerase [Acinetobacter genomosp. 15BJ]